MTEWAESPEDGVCGVERCDRPAAVRLDVPWAGEREVCTAHARTWSQREGVVAMPIETAREEWSHGQSDPNDDEKGDACGADMDDVTGPNAPADDCPKRSEDGDGYHDNDGRPDP